MKRLDPQTYREMSEPFADDAAANAALQAFQRELYELRKKHRIKDVFYVCEIAIRVGEAESNAVVVSGCGDSMRASALFAYAQAKSETELRAAISEYAALGKRMAGRDIAEDE